MLAYDPTPLTLVATAFVALFVMSLVTGRKQRRELDVPWRRVVWMALCVIPISVLPVIIALAMGVVFDTSWLVASEVVGLSAENLAEMQEQGLVTDPVFDRATDTWSASIVAEHWPTRPTFVIEGTFATPPVQMIVVVILWILSIGAVAGAFQPIWRLIGQRVELARVTDEAILERTEALAEQMGGATPRVFRIAGSESDEAVNAMAVGFLAPTIIATDGMLDRLDDAETTATLAHEMGHLVRHHTRRSLFVFGVSTSCATVGSAFLFPSITLVLWLLLLITLQRVHGRREEIECDRMAGAAVGFAPTARALDKICGQAELDSGPLLTRVTQALNVHPARDLRLRHLHDAAPREERASIDFDPYEARAQAITDRLVLGGFVAVMVFGVFAGRSQALQGYGILAGVGLLVTRMALPSLSVLPRLYYAWQLNSRREKWQQFRRVVTLLGTIAAFVAGLWAPYAWPTFAAMALFFWWRWQQGRTQKKMAPILNAVRDGDLDAALERCDWLPRRWQLTADHRAYRAHLLAALDRPEESLEILDALVTESPRAWNTQILRSRVTGWQDNAAALAISLNTAKHLPRNPYALASLAADLSRCEILDQAAEHIDAALRRLPAEASFYAVRSAILRRSGDLEASETELARFSSRSPGSTAIPLYRGYLQLARGEHAAATDSAAEVRSAAEKDRMSLMLPEARRLEVAIAVATGAPIPNE